MLGPLRTVALTTATMIAFAANSLLCRAALRGGAIDAMSFIAIRLVSATVILVAIAGVPRRSETGAGSWRSAIALAAYAITFTYAYVRIGAGAGALLLFGSAQPTMIIGGLIHGERPSLRQWIGLAVAAVGLVVINLPTLDAPPLGGAVLMLAAGVGWGLYSLGGRGATRPIAMTAGNFVRCLPFTAVFAAIAIAETAQLTARGVGLAAASGVVATGLGYCVWYTVLPVLGAARGAIVQLSVPVIATGVAVILLQEPLQHDVAIGGGIILGGLALALWRRRVSVPVVAPAIAAAAPGNPQ